MTLSSQAIIRHQSAARNSDRPALYKARISEHLQSLTDTALIAKRFPFKRDARLPDVGRSRRRHVEQTEDRKVTPAENDALGHAADFITPVGRSQP